MNAAPKTAAQPEEAGNKFIFASKRFWAAAADFGSFKFEKTSSQDASGTKEKKQRSMPGEWCWHGREARS
jgi:hypothetical protein